MIAPLTSSIRSLDDPRVAHYRHIGDHVYLRGRNLLVAEGRLVVRRLLSTPGWEVESVLVTPSAYESLSTTLMNAARPAPVYVVDQAQMNDLVGFNIHRGCLALAVRHSPQALSPTVLAQATKVLMLEGVNNPDNIGGLFRSAAAFGADLVILGPHCGDPLYRKAVRTSMAATLAVPFFQAVGWPDAISTLRDAGFVVIALTPDARAVPLATTASSHRIAILVGAEGEGLSEAALAAADRCVRIPMTGAVDSLNVTTAASIAMYHLFQTTASRS